MYLDANIFVYANFDVGKKGSNARKLLRSLSSGKSATTSALALDEVMWVAWKNKQKDKIRDVIEDIYQVKNLKIVPVSTSIPLAAISLMETHKLRPRDAFHVAIMQELGEESIASDDADFDKVEDIKRMKL
ncbi:MAG: type II toxin-antitoxin system VapC family toxin [Nanoarchaeota archaeon]